MPYDPMTLALGSLSGTTSQAHAHYGLLPGGYSDDPDVLKKDPRHFAIPKDIRAFGEDFAQLYADLSLLAEGAGLPSSAWLAAVFAGASFHHLEDVSNQIHTVQVGSYEFFRAAWLQSKRRDLITLGGLLGRRRPLRQLGLRLVANHHLFSEDLFAKRALAAASGRAAPEEVRKAVAGMVEDDPNFAPLVQEALRASGAPGEGELARRLTDAIVELSSHEGPEVYELAFHLTAPSLHDGVGHEYQSPGDDPDAWLLPPSPQREATLARFYTLEGRGLTRAGTALRAWQRWYGSAAARAADLRPLLVRRTLALLLPYHEQAAARRAKYVPAGPSQQGIAWGYPGAFLALTVGIGLLVRRALR
jgi:hypothetical protein